jgi:hypothetical protein
MITRVISTNQELSCTRDGKGTVTFQDETGILLRSNDVQFTDLLNLKQAIEYHLDGVTRTRGNYIIQTYSGNTRVDFKDNTVRSAFTIPFENLEELVELIGMVV